MLLIVTGLSEYRPPRIPDWVKDPGFTGHDIFNSEQLQLTPAESYTCRCGYKNCGCAGLGIPGASVPTQLPTQIEVVDISLHVVFGGVTYTAVPTLVRPDALPQEQNVGGAATATMVPAATAIPEYADIVDIEPRECASFDMELDCL